MSNYVFHNLHHYSVDSLWLSELEITDSQLKLGDGLGYRKVTENITYVMKTSGMSITFCLFVQSLKWKESCTWNHAFINVQMF